LKVGEVTCAVALYTAASTSERVSFHTINRTTGHRVHRQFVDGRTGKPVEAEDQLKGYELASGEYVTLEPEELADVIPDSDKTLSVSAFLRCSDIDDVYLERPYYLAPSETHAEEAFALIRDGMRKKNVAAIGQAVLFRRVRKLLIRAFDDGLVATTLNFDYEVRSAKEAFEDIPAIKIEDEMLELAEHIIDTKRGKFDPAKFDDRYETALEELVKAKLEGKKIEIRKPAKPEKVVDLMEALRRSAGVSGKKTSRKAPARTKSKSSAKARERKAS
jgi:DNA end-binding protein Ku